MSSAVPIPTLVHETLTEIAKRRGNYYWSNCSCNCFSLPSGYRPRPFQNFRPSSNSPPPPASASGAAMDADDDKEYDEEDDEEDDEVDDTS